HQPGPLERFAMPEDEEDKKPEPAGQGEELEGLEGSGNEVEYEPFEGEEERAEKKEEVRPEPLEESEKKLKAKLKKKEAEVKELKKEIDELKDKYLRKLAEQENLRKRFAREREEYEQYALQDFLEELLIVLDNFERALKTRDQTDGKSFQEGVEMISRQYWDLLKRRGVRPIEITDKKFDPNIHHAVLTEEAEGIEEPEIAEELQRGYWLRDRLLRPSMVRVLVPKKREQP
ncbi:MAG: nucleotide exchange factor GrpE, partial [Acidobacteriota bacterium]